MLDTSVPASMLVPTMNAAIKSARTRTALLLNGTEYPQAFLDSTVQAAINAFTRSTVSAKASRRRLVGKVVRIDEMVKP